MSKITRKLEVTTTPNKDKGRNTFQPKRISWSYLKRGNVARAHRNINRINATLIKNQIKPGIQLNGAISIGGNQPPINNTTVIALIKIMFAYSPRKNNAKLDELYSVK